jgi:hypothetical protein
MDLHRHQRPGRPQPGHPHPGGVFQAVNGDVAPADARGAQVITLTYSDYVLPCHIDFHAHYNMTIGPKPNAMFD